MWRRLGGLVVLFAVPRVPSCRGGVDGRMQQPLCPVPRPADGGDLEGKLRPSSCCLLSKAAAVLGFWPAAPPHPRHKSNSRPPAQREHGNERGAFPRGTRAPHPAAPEPCCAPGTGQPDPPALGKQTQEKLGLFEALLFHAGPCQGKDARIF